MIITENNVLLPQYREEVADELSSVLEYWINNMVDKEHGGFFGSVDNQNIAVRGAPKGVVLNSRILWTFSAAHQRYREQSYLDTATTAYRYIVDHFIDRKYGGVYWSVDERGAMQDGRKQIYGLAFCIYGLTEDFKASGDDVAMHLPEDLVGDVERNSFDKKKRATLS